MRPLTEQTPKPLLTVAGKPLIAWHIEALAAAGFSEIVVNAAYLGDQVAHFCGDGSRWGVRIQMSMESSPLETAGGIIKALPLLGDAPFAVLNADVFTDLPMAQLRRIAPRESGAHLIMVSNPAHHPEGDFGLHQGRVVPAQETQQMSLTYSGIGVFHPAFFLRAGERNVSVDTAEPPKLPLRPLLDRAIATGSVSAEHWTGRWSDIGTPERLAQLDALLSREARH